MFFYQNSRVTLSGRDMFHIIDDFFSKNGLQGQNVVEICTDGATYMSGKYNGLQGLILKCVPQAKWTHCMLHQ